MTQLGLVKVLFFTRKPESSRTILILWSLCGRVGRTSKWKDPSIRHYTVWHWNLFRVKDFSFLHFLCSRLKFALSLCQKYSIGFRRQGIPISKTSTVTFPNVWDFLQESLIADRSSFQNNYSGHFLAFWTETYCLSVSIFRLMLSPITNLGIKIAKASGPSCWSSFLENIEPPSDLHWF